jgi:hypothetical protein
MERDKTAATVEKPAARPTLKELHTIGLVLRADIGLAEAFESVGLKKRNGRIDPSEAAATEMGKALAGMFEVMPGMDFVEDISERVRKLRGRPIEGVME